MSIVNTSVNILVYNSGLEYLKSILCIMSWKDRIKEVWVWLSL